MVSTRSHPQTFPPTSSPAPAPNNKPTPQSTTHRPWTHTPTHLTLLWLLLSLPLVLWDLLYVLLRPHSMPGGSLHAPIWTPYALYGTVDYIYGWPAWEERDGFTAAQSWMNLVELVGYVAYLAVVVGWGEEGGEGEGGKREGEVEGRGFGRGLGWLGVGRVVRGRVAGGCVLGGFGVAVMTVSKTVLYWLNEYCSGFRHIGHNDAMSVVFLWAIPNGLWIVFPSYMIYVFGQEILEGLAIASGEDPGMSRKSTLAIKDE